MASPARSHRGPSTGPALGELLERAYTSFASRPAVTDGDRTITYGELGLMVREMASALSTQHDLQRGDRVAIIAWNCLEYICVEHLCHVAGFARVAMTPRLTPSEVAFIVNDCSASVLFIDEAWVAHLPAVRAELDTSPLIVVIGGMEPDIPGTVAFTSLLGTESDTPRAEPEDPSYLAYTSGTTGPPKGAILSQANMVAVIRNALMDLNIDHEDRILHVAPLSHVAGCFGLMGSIRGCMQVVLPAFDPNQTLKAIEDMGITAMMVVPTILNQLTDAASDRSYDLHTVRAIAYAGSPIAPSRLRQAVDIFGDVFVQFYGLSEAPLPISTLTKSDHRLPSDGSVPDRLGSAGRPHPFCHVRILDATGSHVPHGDVGEIAVRSETVMQGYWNRPEATREVLDADGWLRTGDVGRIDDLGYLYIVDRVKEMIVSGGFNVYSSEVEAAIATIEGVRGAVVVGAPDDAWGEVVVAVITAHPWASLTEDAIISACRGRLAGYKVPKRVDFVDEFPLTSTGKVARRDVRDRYWVGHERSVG